MKTHHYFFMIVIILVAYVAGAKFPGLARKIPGVS